MKCTHECLYEINALDSPWRYFITFKKMYTCSNVVHIMLHFMMKMSSLFSILLQISSNDCYTKFKIMMVNKYTVFNQRKINVIH